MEFVGKTVKKEVKGGGSISGTVKSFDPSSGFVEIDYEDGHSEELEFSDVVPLLEFQPELDKAKPRVGRKPKKRRRVELKKQATTDSGNASDSSVLEGAGFSGVLDAANASASELGCVSDRDLGVENGNGGNLSGNVNGSVMDIGVEESLNRSVSANGDCGRDGLDLNAGLNLNEDLNLNGGCGGSPSNSAEGSLGRRDCIDLNLDVNNEDDANFNAGCSGGEALEQECEFDLNVEVGDEVKEVLGYADGNGHSEVNALIAPMGKLQKEETNVNYRSMEDNGDHNNLNHVSELGGIQVSAEHAGRDTSLCLIEEKEGDGGKENSAAVEPQQVSNAVSVRHCDSDSMEVQQMDCPSEAGFAVVHEDQDEPGSPCKQGSSRRKRRKVSDNLKTTPETVFRRSSRQATARKQVSSPISVQETDDHLLSLETSALTEEKPFMPGSEKFEQCNVDSLPKLQLPPSSKNLNLDDVPVLELFSVYACLRSFSTLLFLSPFELEDLVAALKSESPSILFDSIHVSIMQILRNHLEQLSNEGCQSASNCLRNLNWDFLDLVTWPIFMAEYLLIHGSGFKTCFDINQFMFRTDYYKQAVVLKVGILQYLCDDMIAAEAIRSELNRRSLVTETSMGFDQNVYFDTCKKKRAVMDGSGGVCLTKDIVDDINDWNSDECCLCKMDGNLICCDGCPAAFHSRCVGIASDNLPEGDWYCPECAIGTDKAWMKSRRSLRGAELLGIDLHGRLYFYSCDYLLVSNSSDMGSFFNYYHRNDLHVVIEVLKSMDSSYRGILMAMYKHWDIPADLSSEASNLGVFNQNSGKNMQMMSECSAMHTSVAPFTSSDACMDKNQADDQRKLDKNSIDSSLKSSSSDGGCKIDLRSVGASSSPNTDNKNMSEAPCWIDYTNYYRFARMASLVAQELMCNSSERVNKNVAMSEEEIISDQAKAIMKKSTNFCWPSIQNLNAAAQKEKCGWCISCKVFNDDRDCLLNSVVKPVCELSKSVGLQPTRIQSGHLREIICHIFSLEVRLRGLLLGPWLNLHQTNIWHKDLLKTSDFVAVKRLLLLLESNLRHLAISADWLKHVDSVNTMGSATHIVVSSSRTSSRHGIGRKRARYSDIESTSSSSTTSGLGMYWWRGGRLSRKLFNCKVLPRSLVTKAARQAGCMKIPGVLYLENSDFARRSRYVAWRAAVEMSTSVEQLALQVRELYSNIRWRDVENDHPLYVLDKESRKSVRLFKKVIVRRKCTNGQSVKYLLDFGKRKAIPDIVSKHGSLFEESSSDRKKYWLDEPYVPLHLLKNFEEKRIVRKSDDKKLGKTLEIGGVKRIPRPRGFSYLFSRMERSDYHQCGHCKKDVPIREAVSCLYCKGYFHKRHVKKSGGAITTECTYSCHKCQDGILIETKTNRRKVDSKLQKIESQKCKKVSLVSKPVNLKGTKKASSKVQPLRSRTNKKISCIPLRRSTRTAKSLYKSQTIGGRKKGTQSKKNAGCKKGKQSKNKKVTSQKSKETTGKRKKLAVTAARKQICYSYWLNGLWLSRKQNDERVMLFKEKKHVVSPKDFSSSLDCLKCCLCCGDGCTLNYIACEICGEWFHGDAFGLTVENVRQLIGFRCHVCLNRDAPICPHMNSSSALSPTKNNASNESAEELSNPVSLQPVNEDLAASSCTTPKDDTTFVNHETLPVSVQNKARDQNGYHYQYQRRRRPDLVQ